MLGVVTRQVEWGGPFRRAHLGNTGFRPDAARFTPLIRLRDVLLAGASHHSMTVADATPGSLAQRADSLAVTPSA